MIKTLTSSDNMQIPDAKFPILNIHTQNNANSYTIATPEQLINEYFLHIQ